MDHDICLFPYDVRRLFLRHLTPKETWQLNLVCKNWKQRLGVHAFNIQIPGPLSTYQVIAPAYVRIRWGRGDVEFSWLERYTHSLRFISLCGDAFRNEPPISRAEQSRRKEKFKKFAKLISRCSKLESLQLADVLLWHQRSGRLGTLEIQQLHNDKLKHLQIIVSRIHCFAFLKQFPKLKSFEASYCKYLDNTQLTQHILTHPTIERVYIRTNSNIVKEPKEVPAGVCVRIEKSQSKPPYF